MHHLLVVLERILGLSAVTIAGLVVIALTLASIRALTGHKNVPWTPSDVPAAEARAAKEGYLHRILVALDVFLNVVCLFGYQAETISVHAYRASLQGRWWGRAMNYWLGLIQPNHGQLAASGDLERAADEVTRLNKLLGISK